MKKILVLTNSVDPHADAVIKNIQCKESVFRINTDELLNSFDFEVLLDDIIEYVLFKNPLGDTLDINDVVCVYYRRPEKPIIDIYNSLNKVSIDESWHGLYHVLYQLFDINWLGHPHRDKYSSSRIVQLNAARKIGWKTPSTLISRNPKSIKNFVKKHHDLAIKPLGEKGVLEGENWFPYFTSRINADEISQIDDSEISTTHNYIQNYIEKKNEWRITVIGDKVFPCIIHSQQSEMGKTDWRTVDYNSVVHEKGEISEKFKNELVEYLKFLGLPFGAFDFILTPENDFIFLECNPNGQWLWIEELTGMPISKSIANWLENHIQ